MAQTFKHPKTFYPESDGKPMADNTEQFRWIDLIENGLEILFIADPQVFVAGDLLWYPVIGDKKTRVAPDALVAFGRPKGPRGSYANEYEENISPQVVFEVMSPSNNEPEMKRKREFYEEYGVEEFYIYDPDRGTLRGFSLQPVADKPDTTELVAIPQMQGWVSPRLKVRFGLNGKDLEMYRPDGRLMVAHWQTFERAEKAEQQAQQERMRAEQAERLTAQTEQWVRYERTAKETAQQSVREAEQRTEQAQVQVQQERLRAEQAQIQAQQERMRAEQERLRAEKLTALLKQLDPDLEL